MSATRRSSSLRSTAGSTALAALGVAGAVPSCYLAVLSLAAWRARRRAGDMAAAGDVAAAGVVAAAGEALSSALPELVVLVPAHDEAELIERCVRSLRAQRYPAERFRVVVVADNCTDRTAELADAAGAQVLVRSAPVGGGKGAALRWAMDRLLDHGDAGDAFVVVDADTVSDPAMLSGLAARWQAGAVAVQGDYSALPEPGARGELRGAAFLLFHRVRFGGRAALGLPCALVGNGMLLGRQLVQEHPWTAVSAAEDLEYSTDLRLSGVRPVFAADARLAAPVSSGGPGARTQRLRWEGGRAHVVRTRLPRLVRGCLTGRGAELWDAALDLAVPPLGVLTVGLLAGGTGVAVLSVAGAVRAVVLAPWVVAVLAVPVHVLVGLAAAGAPRSTYQALLTAPALVAGELVTRARLLAGTDADVWVRTARPGETAALGSGPTHTHPPQAHRPQAHPPH